MHSDIKTIFLHFLLGLYDFDEDLLKDVVELIANEQMEIMAEEIVNEIIGQQ